jgi:hypothetical protein
MYTREKIMQAIKKVVLFSIVVGLIITAYISWYGKSGITLNENPEGQTGENPAVQSMANWVSQADTVSELSREADLIVFARVRQAPVSRIVTQELPMLDENGQTIGMATDSLPFSDTLFEVIKTYSGPSLSEVLVMQTGGTTPATQQTVQMVDDPLYTVGEEYILFLVDISGDEIHASDRQLYRTVNPAGRFQVVADAVIAIPVEGADEPLPATVDALEKQIMESRQERLTTP